MPSIVHSSLRLDSYGATKRSLAQLGKSLVAARRIEVRQLASLVQTVADSDGVAAAQALGEAALVYTRNDDLLAVLITLAERAHDDAAQARYQQWRSEAATARAVLEKPKAPGAERVSGSM